MPVAQGAHVGSGEAMAPAQLSRVGSLGASGISPVLRNAARSVTRARPEGEEDAGHAEPASMEDLVDVNAEQESTGATTGNNRFDPDRDGTLASLPSKWAGFFLALSRMFEYIIRPQAIPLACSCDDTSRRLRGR